MSPIWVVLFSLEGLTIILANVLSLVIFFRKFRHLKTCILLINLSVADLLAGLFVVNLIFRYTTEFSLDMAESACSDSFLSTLLDFSHQGILESIITLAIIAFERAFAVIKPRRHRVIKTRYYQFGIGLTWIISSIPTAIGLAMRCKTRIRELVFSLSFAIEVASLIIMFVAYVAIYIKLRFFPVFQHNANTQMQMKLLKTLFIATAASIGTMLPFGVYLGYTLSCKACVPNQDAYKATIFLSISNSFINFVIYTWKMPEFGREVKKLICFCCKANLVHADHRITSNRETKVTYSSRAIGKNRVFDVNIASNEQ